MENGRTKKEGTSGTAGQEEKHTQKEQDILDAAVRLFSEKGFTGTTTLSIAQQAGTTEKTLFKYFKSKQELYDRVLSSSLYSMAQEKLSSYQKAQKGLYGAVEGIYRERLKLANENPDLLKLTIHEFLMNTDFRSGLSSIWQNVYLPAMMKELEVSESKSQKYKDQLVGGFTRAMVMMMIAYTIDKSYIRPEREFDDEKEMELMLDILFNGLNGLKEEANE